MSVPLDRLYNHLDGLCNHDVLIYHWAVHGSKKLEDIFPLYHEYANLDWVAMLTTPLMLAHDQEPLNFKLYSEDDFVDCIHQWSTKMAGSDATIRSWVQDLNLRVLFGQSRYSLYDRTMIVHSEKNSNNLMQYEQAGFVGIYWWAHAAIAMDWYRYAEHDPVLAVNLGQVTHDFLIYNRAWSGSREYRLKFTELIVNSDLHHQCIMKFTPRCNDQHYKEFVSANPSLSLGRYDLEDYFDPSSADANASGDYNNHDYQHTAVEIVLETLFDDTRHHLTEKTLRPIACGRPFILAATPGSLAYVRSYGFETFGDFIDESYDNILDPAERLAAICREMQKISQLPQEQKFQLWTKLYQIAQRNQQRFFSKEWQQSIFQEFVDNYNSAMSTMNQYCTGKHWKKLQLQTQHKPQEFWDNMPVLHRLKASMDNAPVIQQWIADHAS